MPHVDPLAVDSPLELLLRLGLAALLGLLLGLDREMRGHDAGIRTHALVALSSAMIMISSLLLFDELKTDTHAPDPLRAVQIGRASWRERGQVQVARVGGDSE